MSNKKQQTSTVVPPGVARPMNLDKHPDLPKAKKKAAAKKKAGSKKKSR